MTSKSLCKYIANDITMMINALTTQQSCKYLNSNKCANVSAATPQIPELGDALQINWNWKYLLIKMENNRICS